jgi:hypothetical protein
MQKDSMRKALNARPKFIATARPIDSSKGLGSMRTHVSSSSPADGDYVLLTCGCEAVVRRRVPLTPVYLLRMVAKEVTCVRHPAGGSTFCRAQGIGARIVLGR